MPDFTPMFERQAEWQRTRAKLSWTEKLRMAARLRGVAMSMRRPVREKRAAVAKESRARYGSH